MILIFVWKKTCIRRQEKDTFFNAMWDLFIAILQAIKVTDLG